MLIRFGYFILSTYSTDGKFGGRKMTNQDFYGMNN